MVAVYLTDQVLTPADVTMDGVLVTFRLVTTSLPSGVPLAAGPE
jgi:hypothetical protein